MARRFGLFLAYLLLVSSTALCGPPFLTDDPEPVDYLHWEFYIASMQTFSRSETDATLPHVEINYGAFPRVQLHLILPMGFISVNGMKQYGFSDTEFGIKYRFVDETPTMPQVGAFPLVEIPTASVSQNIGNGTVQLFLPVWVQKSWDRLTTYGGAGWWYNPAPEQKNWFFTGWELQYDFSKTVTLGGEGFFHTATRAGGMSDAGFNLGGFINFDETNHLLFSFGHNMLRGGVATGYIGYQMTI